MRTAEVKLEGTLAAAPEVIWSRLVDLEELPIWLEGVEGLTVIAEGPTTRRRFQLRNRALGDEVLAVPGNRLGFAVTGISRWIPEAYLQAELYPDRDGTRLVTRLRLSLRPNLIAPLLRPIVRLRAEVWLLRAMRNLRSWIEERPAAVLVEEPEAHDLRAPSAARSPRAGSRSDRTGGAVLRKASGFESDRVVAL